MSIDTDDKNNGNSFEYKLREVSDEEIISILRFRDHFQPHAVNAAIKEALKRGLIETIDDLNSDKFKPQELAPRRLFPLGNTPMQTLAIFKSLCRIFYGFGLLPFIYGIFQIIELRYLNGITFSLLGILTIFAANRLEKTHKNIYSIIFILMNIPAIVFGIIKLKQTGNPSNMDIVAVVIILLIILYTTLYAYKLLPELEKNKHEK